MHGADFIAAAQRRLQALGLRVSVHEVDAALWLKVDSFSLLLALASLGSRLFGEHDIQRVELRLSAVAAARAARTTQRHKPQRATRAHLDLLWIGQAMTPKP
jgi:DNA polymerase-3 subunit epsilon